MAETTGISWTRSTFNPWIGCTKVGPGCDHCYAEGEDARRRWGGATHWGAGVPRFRTSAANWNNPRDWQKAAERDLVTGRVWGEKVGFYPVFCASLADVFDNEVPPEWRADLWRLVKETPSLTWQLVTKRVGNVMGMIPEGWRAGLPPNVWVIATMVNQEEFDRDWHKLAAIPAHVRGLSVEPMLGPIRFPPEVRGRLHWVIYGGESTQASGEARPCDLGWIQDGVEQCRSLGISPFVKQLGHRMVASNLLPGYPYGAGKRADPALWPISVRVQEFPR